MQDFEINLRQYQRIEAGETINITLATLFSARGGPASGGKIAKAFKVTVAELIKT